MRNQLRRAIWHASRTPLVHVMKAGVAAAHPSIKRRRRRAGAAVAVPAPIDAKVRALRAAGYVPLDDVIDPALLRGAAAAGLAKLAEADASRLRQGTATKSFWSSLLDTDLVDGLMPADHPIVRFALQPALIAFATARMGEMPLLDSALLTLSFPTAEPLSKSQLWHRDHDDVPTLKVFTYFTDVATRDDGPFTFVPAPHADRVGLSLHSHLPDAEFFGRAPRDAVHEMMLPAMSTFAVETSRCWHMGSRVAPGHRRLMLTLTYVTGPRFYPGFRPPFRDTGGLDERERLVLGLEGL